MTILPLLAILGAPTSWAGPPSGPSPAAPTPVAPPVIVNGTPLSAAQIQAITVQYRVVPQPGSYWYDSRSGLFGYVGQGAAGAMRPGHALGALSPTASAGRTGIFVNGRQIPMTELAFYQSLVGPVRPGRYWMDGFGNVGFEGVPSPLVNLVAVMASRGGRSWSGEANLGGYWPMTSGTWDTSGGGNHVISVDGEVLNLPPY